MLNKIYFFLVLLLSLNSIKGEIIIQKKDSNYGKNKDEKKILILNNKNSGTNIHVEKNKQHKKTNSLEEYNLMVIKEAVKRICYEHEMNHKLIESMVEVESNFNPYAISYKGAKGLMQLMPQTAKAYDVKNIFNIYENLEAGIKYFKYLFSKYNQNARLALAAYNAGPTAVNRYNSIPPYRETQNYVKKILRLFKKRGGNISELNSNLIVFKDDEGVIITNQILKD